MCCAIRHFDSTFILVHGNTQRAMQYLISGESLCHRLVQGGQGMGRSLRRFLPPSDGNFHAFLEERQEEQPHYPFHKFRVLLQSIARKTRQRPVSEDRCAKKRYA
ncbi:hypothetical protein CDAR_371621 [Caerostris darwini]|uniref:Uncharacterized protein n=1 Tax=Caerostris darwini TaxID=1538125 RepID=A0AAV4XBG7_9ARAC|nr:hypothetical protein CDAR_371621 [Caerostris darwini]